MSSLSARMLKRLYSGQATSRVLEPVVRVNPLQTWFRRGGLDSPHQLFKLRWQSCWRRPASQPFVTRVGEELSATMQLWAAGTGWALQIDSSGLGMPGVIWPPYCSVLVFKYREPQL